jgi:FtsH-binding integral membrane protein
MNKIIPISAITVFLIILIIAIFKFAFKKSRFTCSKYILNTYLYILLSFIIIVQVLLLLDFFKFKTHISKMYFISVFLISLLLLICTLTISPEKIYFKHILWLLLMVSYAVLFFPVYKHENGKNMVSSMITTSILLLILSIIAFLKPELISLKIGPILFILLVAGIIFQIATYFCQNNKTTLLYKALSYFFIVLFMLYILYDTKMLLIRANNCKNPDYINESMNLFLDISNIFIRLVSLQN